MLKKYIKKVTDRQDLSFEEMQQVFEIITTGQTTDAQIAAFLIWLKM
jgi:anthranilate phosphoribosyltransferase